VKNNRPVNLDLMTMRYPVSAIASLLHRITGMALFVAIGFMLWALSASLESPEGFALVQGVLTHPLAKLIAWGIASFIVYHLFAGIKHLLMDAGHFETIEGGALASQAVLGVSLVGIILVGVWIW
jgi:succinate dehydrogenase / fumarate reductase cytochrome b subunit